MEPGYEIKRLVAGVLSVSACARAHRSFRAREESRRKIDLRNIDLRSQIEIARQEGIHAAELDLELRSCVGIPVTLNEGLAADHLEPELPAPENAFVPMKAKSSNEPAASALASMLWTSIVSPCARLKSVIRSSSDGPLSAVKRKNAKLSGPCAHARPCAFCTGIDMIISPMQETGSQPTRAR
jgi:hypothetical protein